MKKRINKASQVIISGKKRDKKIDEFNKHEKSMAKIKSSLNTVEIKYPEYKEAFDYVDKLFPGSKVKNVSLYKVSPKYLESLGYGGAGGFYCKNSKAIVISSYTPVVKNKYHSKYNFSIRAKITKDEVIVHELCHYCFVEEGSISGSREINEEFAYGWSIGYLRSKGHSDDFIIKKNFFPFLVEIKSKQALEYVLKLNGITRKEYDKFSNFKRKDFFKKYGKKWHEKRKELAYKYGEELISLYDRKAEEGMFCAKDVVEINRFDILDLD